MMLSQVGLLVLSGLVIILIFVLIRLYLKVISLGNSFAKLGFVVREDAKKYFNEASDKIVETNHQFQEVYKQLIHDGTLTALAEAGEKMEKNIIASHQEASKIVLEARINAQRIIAAGKNEATATSEQALSQSAETIRWVMQQFTGRTLNLDDHQQIIEKLMDDYINEQRK